MEQPQRTELMIQFENELRSKGYQWIAGVDEVGRGPLAGPVVAAACILPPDFDLPGLNDSKKLTEKKRDSLAVLIQEQAVAYSYGSADHLEIDRINILNASKLAMKRALEGLRIPPDYVLVDGRDMLDISVAQQAVIGGDARCACIAAASIIAKVARDKLMAELHELYPVYQFDRHKGYPTSSHFEALQKYGPCPLHRRSFSPVREMITSKEVVDA